MRWFIILFLYGIQTAHAFSWQDLWATKDQQAKAMMAKGEFAKAKDTFERDDWRATSAYRAGDYEQAAKLYPSVKNEDAYYNQGNALAHMGQYELAIKAYDKTLAYNPDNQDALYNRKIVEDLLKKDKEKQKQDKQKQDKQKQDKQNQDKQNQDKQDQDKQKQNKQDQDKQKQETQPASKPSQAEREKQQAKEQWLRLIPDDPGGLMREKFMRDHLRRQHGWDQ